ncbi:MAG: LysR family transcriptional regulator [Thermaurantiacus sp.]
MRRSLLPLNALRVFDAAARTLSFTRAAEELAVTPAAVGQQVRALEETLGVILFRRTPRGLELTPEAADAMAAVRDGFASLEESVRRLQAGQAATRMTLAVARPALRHWLAPRLAGWLSAHPETSVRVVPLDGPVDFAEANLDLAVHWGAPPDAEGVFGRKLAEERLLRVAAPGGADRALRWGGAAEADGALLLADAGDALDLALMGLGIAEVPETLAAGHVAAGRLETRGEARPSDHAFWLCAPAPQWKSAKVKALVEVLQANGGT